MTVCGGVEVKLNEFLIPQVNGDEWSVSRLGHSSPGKKPLYPSTRRLGASESRFGHCAEVYNNTQCKSDIKSGDDGKLTELLTFWTLSIMLIFI
jgi:hypothetical protein